MSLADDYQEDREDLLAPMASCGSGCGRSGPMRW